MIDKPTDSRCTSQVTSGPASRADPRRGLSVSKTSTPSGRAFQSSPKVARRAWQRDW